MTDSFENHRGPFRVNGSVKSGIGAVFTVGGKSLVVIVQNIEQLRQFHEDHIVKFSGMALDESITMPLSFAPTVAFEIEPIINP